MQLLVCNDVFLWSRDISPLFRIFSLISCYSGPEEVFSGSKVQCEIWREVKGVLSFGIFGIRQNFGTERGTGKKNDSDKRISGCRILVREKGAKI